MVIKRDIYTTTGRLRSEITIVGDTQQLPPGTHIGVLSRIVFTDFSQLEDRIGRIEDLRFIAYPFEPDTTPKYKKPRKYTDVPFWCKKK